MFSTQTHGKDWVPGSGSWVGQASEGPQADPAPWDSSDPFFTASTRVLLQRVFLCYVRQGIVFLGIPGNLLCCLAFWKLGLSDHINLLLWWLALADLCNLLLQLLLTSACYLQETVQADNWAVLVNTIIAPLNHWLCHVSATLAVVVSVDRCLFVTVPLKAKIFLTYRLTVAVIALSYLVPLAFSLPRFLAFKVSWRSEPSTNHSIAYMEVTPWFPLDSRMTLEVRYYFNMVTKSLSLVIVLVCCSITIVKLRQASRQRVRMVGKTPEDGRAGDNRVNVMLMVICLVYVFLALPEIACSLMVMIIPEYFVYRKYHNSFIVHYQFIWTAVCMNSAVNFLVYVLLGSRFRKALLTCFTDCCTRKKQGS